MGTRKIPKAIFEPLENVTCAELVAMPSLVAMVEVQAPAAIREAIKSKKPSATLFEINGLGLYVDILRQDWISALQQCMDHMTAAEKFEDCIPLKELIDDIKKDTKPVASRIIKKKEVEEPLDEIKSAVDHILNVNSIIRKKKEQKITKKRDLFVSIITSIERLINRQDLLYAEFNSDLSTYDDPFFSTIDSLIILHFGKEGAELIAFYLWDRVAPDGSINSIVAADGTEVVLKNAKDLWNLLVATNPNYEQ